MASAKILIVEDGQNSLSTLAYNPGREGYDVATAIDGAQALELAHKEMPDLVFPDITLPESSGYEFYRILIK